MERKMEGINSCCGGTCPTKCKRVKAEERKEKMEGFKMQTHLNTDWCKVESWS